MSLKYENYINIINHIVWWITKFIASALFGIQEQWNYLHELGLGNYDKVKKKEKSETHSNSSNCALGSKKK